LLQTQHPLQWHGQVSAPFAILRCEPTPKKNRHASAINRGLRGFHG
jgi:hypothetical protein